MTLVQGVVLFIFVKLISDFIGFTTISYLMNQVINYGAIAAVCDLCARASFCT